MLAQHGTKALLGYPSLVQTIALFIKCQSPHHQTEWRKEVKGTDRKCITAFSCSQLLCHSALGSSVGIYCRALDRVFWICTLLLLFVWWRVQCARVVDEWRDRYSEMTIKVSFPFRGTRAVKTNIISVFFFLNSRVPPDI